ncbi:MAG: PQQ-binding-like beta-propeller repeat protein [Pseudomonadota bacterium]
MRFSFLSSRLLSVPARPLRTAFGVVGLVMVAGCSGGPLGGGLFGGDDTTEIDLNDDGRIPVLALEDIVKADARYAGLSVSTPPSYVNNSWPQPGGEADHTLHHLSAELGFDLAWQADVGKASNRLELVLAPPVIADGKVYVVDAEAKVSAFDEEDGSLVWRTELTQDVSERFRLQEMFQRPKAAQEGFGGGVAYEGGTIFVSSGFGFVAALDAETGEQQWLTKTDAPIRTPPTAYRGSVYATTITNDFLSFDQETGEKNWNFQSFEEAARILSSSSAAAAGDLVVAPFSSGELVAFLTENGRPLWTDSLVRNAQLTALSTLNDIAGSPVIDRGLVYAVSHAGQLVAIDIRSGDRVWAVSVAGLQMPWVAGDFIYLVSVDSELVCVSREHGAIVWVSQLRKHEKVKKKKGRIAWAGPVLAGDHLVLVSSAGELVKVAPTDGEIIETKKIKEGSLVSPVVSGEKIYVLTQKGKLRAYQ